MRLIYPNLTFTTQKLSSHFQPLLILAWLRVRKHYQPESGALKIGELFGGFVNRFGRNHRGETLAANLYFDLGAWLRKFLRDVAHADAKVQ